MRVFAPPWTDFHSSITPRRRASVPKRVRWKYLVESCPKTCRSVLSSSQSDRTLKFGPEGVPTHAMITVTRSEQWETPSRSGKGHKAKVAETPRNKVGDISPEKHTNGPLSTKFKQSSLEPHAV